MLVADDLLDGHLLSEALEWVLALETLKLDGRVLVKEFVDGHEAAADLDQNLSALNLDVDATLAELIDAS